MKLWIFFRVFVTRIVDSDNRANFIHAFWFESLLTFLYAPFSLSLSLFQRNNKIIQLWQVTTKLNHFTIGFRAVFVCEIISMFKQLNNLLIWSFIYTVLMAEKTVS